MESRRKTKYLYDFLSIFFAVISAFALNNWNDNRKDSNAESKILLEILHGLEKDIVDVRGNIEGHKQGIAASAFWRSVFLNEAVSLDSLERKYFLITRDFISIQNTSGYETLKSKGLELLENDELRPKIVSLYEYDYQVLLKLEEEYQESQFHQNYFSELNNFIAPNLIFNSEGEITGLTVPLNLEKNDRQIMLSYLWKIEANRAFIMRGYDEVENKIEQLIKEIKRELS